MKRIAALFRHNFFIITTFVASFLIMTLAFATENLFPFGENQIMIIDSWHQYYPFLHELHAKLQNGESLFYSWNTGAGTNFIVLLAYYAMSPLNLLSVFFPEAYLREFMLFATITKIALAGAFFGVYIRGIFKRNDVSLFIFGILYAFSAYAVGYYWCWMWLDGMALLPLIILGLHRLLDEEGFGLYTLTLAVALISNFYIGYFICEFIIIYAVALYILKYGWQGMRHLLQKAFDTVMYSFIGAGLAAVTLVPTYYGMRRAYGFSSGDPTAIETYYSILDILNNLLANVPPTIKNGMPNIACGILALLLVIFYFLNNRVALKNKVVNFLLLLFFLFSFNLNYMDFAWHGFHFPNEVPHRFAFLFSFLLLTLAYEAYAKWNATLVRHIWVVGAVLTAYLIHAEKLYTETFDFTVFYVSLLIVLFYCGVLLLQKYGKISENTLVYVLCAAVAAEALLAGINGVRTAGNSGREDYPTQKKEIEEAIEKLYKEDKGFYRLELAGRYTVNDPALYRYRGISQFDSTGNAALNDFTDRIGLPSDAGANTLMYEPSTPITNGLFSIKYLLSRENAVPMPNAAYAVVGEYEGLQVLKNRFWFPPGFMMNDNVDQWKADSINPFENYEDFLHKATGQPATIFEDVPVASESYTNMTRTRLERDIRYHYQNINKDKDGHAKIDFTAPRDGQMYLYMLNQTRTANLALGGKIEDFETRRGIILDLGILKAGETFSIDFDVLAAETGYFDIQAVVMDAEEMEAFHSILASEPLTVDKFSDTHVSGRVDVQNEGVLYVSIPYEKGWTVKVDGKKAEILKFQDAMIALKLSKGHHRVELNYLPEGMMGGAMISAFAVVAFLENRRLARRKAAQTAAEAMAASEAEKSLDESL